MSELSLTEHNNLSNIAGELKELFAKNHEHMISKIVEWDDRIVHDTKNFCRHQSQFMDKMLTVSHPTPFRNLRQILAEIASARDALKDAFFNHKRALVKIKILERKSEKEKDDLEKELIDIDIQEAKANLVSGMQYVNAAIRRIAGYLTEYESILKKLNIKTFDELDFEKHEEEYHIKKAFEQALISARSRGGVIDEGNHIYLFQLGISGVEAQIDVSTFLEKEFKYVQNTPYGKNPHTLILTFLDEVYNKYKGRAQIMAQHKGMSDLVDKGSLLIDDIIK